MGTEIYASGKLQIIPPAPWSKIRGLLTSPDYSKSHVLVAVNEHATETDEGTLTHKEGVALTPRHARSTRNDSTLLDQLQRIVTRIGPEHDVRGYLECVSEDPDVPPWRICVSEGTVLMVTPTIIWNMPESAK